MSSGGDAPPGDHRAALLLVVLVFVPALLLRIHPIVSESFQYDAVVSQLAAQRGFWANAWDEPRTYDLRRHHPPLLSYVISINNRLVGDDEFRARLFSIVAGAATCAVVASMARAASGSRAWSLPAGLFAGWLLAFLPVHLSVSRTANWDAVYALFATVALGALSTYWSRPSIRTLALACLTATLGFLTCEIGLTLLPVFGIVFMRDARRFGTGAALRRWGVLSAGALALFTLLWPAGLLKGHVVRTIIDRVRDSALEGRNRGWSAFYSDLFRQAPGFVIASLAGVGAVGFAWWQERRGPAATTPRSSERFAGGAPIGSLLPFVVYVIAGVVLSTKQRLVYLHHIVDLCPSLAVLAGCALFASVAGVRRSTRGLIGALAIVCLVLSVRSSMTSDPRVVGPEEHPGYLGVRDFVREHPGLRTYYYYADVMEYYAPDAEFVGTPPRHWTEEKVRRVKSERYDFVVSDWVMWDARFPDVESLAAALAPEYRLAHVVRHKRTQEPVAWIFERAS